MMKNIVLFLAALVCNIPDTSSAQRCTNDSTTMLSDANIMSAIADGRDGRNVTSFGYNSEVPSSARLTIAKAMLAASGVQGFPRAIAYGPYNSIATASMTATEKYMSYGRRNVDSTLLLPYLTVIITPGAPGRDARFDSEAMTEIKHIILMSVNANDTTIVQPFEVRQEPVVYSNRFGASVTLIRAIAKFCLTDVPPTNFNIVGVTNLGPTRPAAFWVDEKNRKLIR